MNEEFNINKKISSGVVDYLIRNHAKEGEQLVDRRYKTNYLNKIGKGYLSE